MAGSEYYDHTTYPSTGAAGSSSALRSELDLIEAGFGKLPALVGNSLKIVGINSGETALVAVATTGTGSVVLATSPTLVTPALGTPASGVLTNCTGLPAASITGLGAGVATFLATPSSANLITAVTDETGTGALVFANTPTLVAPLLGTPTSGVLTNCTGLPLASITGLAANVSTFLSTPSSANLIAAVTDETGTGALVFANTPTLVTPALGVATATSINKVTITAPASSATLTIADGKTFTVNQTLTITGTSGTTMTFPATSATIARTDAANTFTGTQTFSGLITASLGLNVTGAAFTSLGIADNATANIITISSAGRTTIAPSTTLTGATQYGLVVNPTTTSAATGAGVGIYVSTATVGASYTQTSTYGVQIDDAGKGAGSTITNQYGIAVLDQTKGGTLIAGYSGQVSSGTGKWNAYMSGSASNAFAGSVRIGSVVAPTAPLDVTGAAKVSSTLTVGDSVIVNKAAGSTDEGNTNYAAYLNTLTPGTTANYLRFAGAVSTDVYVGRPINLDQIWVGAVNGAAWAKITSTGLNSTAVGATTTSTGAFTTITSSGGVSVDVTSSSAVEFAGTGTRDAVHSGLTLRNTSAGTSAALRSSFGNSASATTFTIDVFGGSHATKPSYVELINQFNAALYLGGWGSAQLALSNTGAAVTGVLSATTTITATTGMAVGAATAGAGGVAFPATAVAVADANTLDDYEEGTWTPAFVFGAGSCTYTTQAGTYTKIGRQVTVHARIVVNTVTTPSGVLQLGSLPFTNSSGDKGAISFFGSAMAVTSATEMMGYVESSATTILIRHFAAGSSANAGADIAAGCTVYVSATYEI